MMLQCISTVDASSSGEESVCIIIHAHVDNAATDIV